MVTSKRITFRTHLLCGHEILWSTMSAPRKGASVLCFKCNAYQVVLASYTCVWKWACQQCSRCGSNGQRKRITVQQAKMHAFSCNHEVIVFDPMGVIYDRITPHGTQLIIDLALPENTTDE